jgi:hypothetical protein
VGTGADDEDTGLPQGGESGRRRESSTSHERPALASSEGSRSSERIDVGLQR